MDWTLVSNLSAQGGGVDDLYYLILVITGIAFVLVEVGILWFVVRYRNRDADYTHGSNRLEVLWTAVPALVMIFLGIYSGRVWASLKSADAAPADAFTVEAQVKQFEWNFVYPGADGELGTEDDFTERNHLHVPVERPVKVRLVSQDVIHSFFIPELRVKQDAVPGMVTSVWFEATEPGSLELSCAELCGLGHYRMRSDVTIHEPGQFATWHADRSTEASGGA
jgi:cytochrome c oxidase subunit 2